VGVASPGAISSRTGLVKNSNSIALNGKPFDRILRKTAPADRLENDANCLALSRRSTVPPPEPAWSSVSFWERRGRRRRCRQAVGRRTQQDRRRMGPQSTALGQRERTARRTLLLRQVGCVETFLSGAGLARDYRDRSGTPDGRRYASPPPEATNAPRIA